MPATQSSHSIQLDILIVEDDTLQRDLLAAALLSHGYHVEVASNGLDAVRHVRERGCDLMLIDYNIPEIDGLATARVVRDLMGVTACPAIIALTQSPDIVTRRQAESGGAFDGIIAKPIRLNDLLSVIGSCLEVAPNRETRRAAQAALLYRYWAEYDAGPIRAAGENIRHCPPRILVVEDDGLQQSLLQSALQSCGYVVETADDGLQAFRMVRAGSFDLVLIDYQLPEINGFTTARLILDLMNETVRPRMVALTAAPTRLGEVMLETGSAFDEVLTKSSDLQSLLAVVARQLRSAPNPATRNAVDEMYSSDTDRQ